MIVSSIASYLPRMASPTQMLHNVRNVAVMTVALLALSNLTAVLANCEENELICVRSCRGGDPRDAGACLLGCKLAYWVCKLMGG